MLLKAGVYLMAFALAFAGVVAVIAIRDEPMQTASATKPAAEPTVEPLIREYLPPKPEVKKAELSETTEPQNAEPAPEPRPGPTGMPWSFAQLMKSATIRK